MKWRISFSKKASSQAMVFSLLSERNGITIHGFRARLIIFFRESIEYLKTYPRNNADRIRFWYSILFGFVKLEQKTV